MIMAPELMEACEHTEMDPRDKPAYLGIYARPELYELSGACTIKTQTGIIDIGAACPYGIAFPGTAVDSIAEIDLSRVQKVVFIENKTNYDEYLGSELEPGTLAAYHAGFLSPQKRKPVSRIANAVFEGTPVYFWADIDLGGIQMFVHLRQLIPGLQPMRMSGKDVALHWGSGLTRSGEYLEPLKQAQKTFILCLMMPFGKF